MFSFRRQLLLWLLLHLHNSFWQIWMNLIRWSSLLYILRWLFQLRTILLLLDGDLFVMLLGISVLFNQVSELQVFISYISLILAVFRPIKILTVSHMHRRWRSSLQVVFGLALIVTILTLHLEYRCLAVQNRPLSNVWQVHWELPIGFKHVGHQGWRCYLIGDVRTYFCVDEVLVVYMRYAVVTEYRLMSLCIEFGVGDGRVINYLSVAVFIILRWHDIEFSICLC